MEKKQQKKLKVKKSAIGVVLLILIGFGLMFMFGNKLLHTTTSKMYLANNVYEISLYDENLNVAKTMIRGTKVVVSPETKTLEDGTTLKLVTIDDEKYYVNETNLVSEEKKSVQENTVYVKTPATVIANTDTGEIAGMVKKGDVLEVIDYDKIADDGSVNIYKIKQDELEGYVHGKYLTFTSEEALKNYNASELDEIHTKARDLYGGGSAINLDYYPRAKGNFSDNVMPDNVYALYLNNGSNVIKNIQAYIDFAKDTNINAFVIDIKDNQTPGYKSNVLEELSPTNYENAINSYEDYKNAVSLLKSAGFYVIGRITTFKDSYYALDHPEDTILANGTDKPYLHQGAYWPSPYSRDVWYFNISLAKEAVQEMGFNEINFDYVRFPDRTQSAEVKNLIDYNNIYGEEKAQAIQAFLMYATDELHQLHVYVSADVFGESVASNYVTAYGQYWASISNIVDVISAMPYPDHFDLGNYGLATPWTQPYKLMSAWASDAAKRQAETPSPAIGRTWIESHNATKSPYNSYGANEVKDQITANYENGLDGGYMTWLSNSSLEKYNTQKEAFKIDYGGKLNE